MPPPPLKNGNGTQVHTPKKMFSVSTGAQAIAQKIIIYGSGGVGKTELASLIAKNGINPLFLDIGDGTNFLDVQRVKPNPQTWDDMRDALHSPELWKGFNAIVIDDLTKAEEMATDWAVANIPHEKGHKVDSIEGYGFGKGLTHVYETFMKLLGDLDAHAREGRWVICIAHECTANVPNPSGADWIRFEPRLQSPASGKNSIRHRVKEWADHLLYVGFDTIVNKEGKASGGGTRTIYPTELPTWLAKSRSLSEPIPYYRGDNELWTRIMKGENHNESR